MRQPPRARVGWTRTSSPIALQVDAGQARTWAPATATPFTWCQAMEQIRGPPILCGKLYNTRTCFPCVLIDLTAAFPRGQPPLFPWELQSHFHALESLSFFITT